MKDIVLNILKLHPVCDFENFNKLIKFITSDPAVREAAGEMVLLEFQDTVLEILVNENPWSIIISK